MYARCQLVTIASCARHPFARRLRRVNLGEKVSAPSPSSMIGVFKFAKTNFVITPRDDVIEHSPDYGAVYLNVYRRFRDAVASRRPPPDVSDVRASLALSLAPGHVGGLRSLGNTPGLPV